jgi:6-phosphogluconolactonase
MSGENPELRVLDSGEAVAHAAAHLFVRYAGAAQAARGAFRVALSGGSTPKLLYRLLASPEFRGQVDWGNIDFAFGDERWVPHDHPDSNYKLAQDELFSKVPVDPERIFPMPTEDLAPEEAAVRYAETLSRIFDIQMGEIPSFDLLFLGMGDDGHTASCFPDTEAVREAERVVVANFVPKLGSYRLTITPPVMQSAEHVVVMVAGEGKAPALREVLEGDYNPDVYPSQLLRKCTGKVIWLVDKAAAAQLTPGVDA